MFAEVLLHGAGIQAIRRGTVIYSGAGGGFQFDVADACSGLRSLVVMTALAAPYAYFTLKGHWRKWTLFALSVPLAMLANALRIFTLALVAELIGMRLAMSLYHDFSGYLVFVISVGLLMGTGSLLEIDWRARWRAWKRSVTSRT
jgi:exosortase